MRVAMWLGVITVAIGLWVTSLLPQKMGPLADGMRTPIIAFELARSADEVETMFGPRGSRERSEWIGAMDRGNHADLVFLVAYGLFFAVYSRALVTRGGTSAKWGIWLAAVPSAMDVFENLQLAAIMRSLGGDYSVAVSRLAWFCWAKWFAIAAICVTWVPALWKLGTIGRVTAAAAGFTASITVVAYFTRGTAAELMGLGVALTLLSALTFAFRNSRSA